MAILDYSGILNQGGGLNAGQSAINTMGALQGLGMNRLAMQEAQDQKLAQQQAQQQQREARRTGSELLTSGSPDEIAAFGIQHPEIMKDFISAAQFQDQQAVSSRLKYAQDVLSGNASPRAATIERIQEVESNGGDASGLRRTIQGSDEDIIKAAEKDIAVISPKMYESYRKSTGKTDGMTAYQQAMITGQDADREVRKLEAENKRIDNQLKRETNQVKLDELKQKQIANADKITQKLKSRSDAAQSTVESGKSTLNLINEIRSHPGLSSAIGAKGASSAFGLLDDPIAGTEAAGVKSLIDTLDAQNFLTAIGEFKAAGGAGALSDNEGKKLGAALSNLSRDQSEKDFMKSLKVIESLVKKQISKASPQIDKKFSLEQTNGNQVTSELSDADLLKKYGG